MSRLAEFRALEAQIAEELARLDAMKADEKLKAEMDFERKLIGLMAAYDKSLRDIIMILDPHVGRSSAKSDEGKGNRKARAVKIYEHPDTKERIETKGGNHKTLKAWKDEHGSEMVESWRIQ
ncbi:histone-like nucleoid-structuring protein, MvaT/MvaU family [Pseudomonas benzenivorans]|uniref:Histone-like nucleoid-structuring protein, MvaT/MvaU family n=1 Tax=Pseudomonas benzenivorans TaxID=556533 RepID=A0ABZ0PQQ4_9PSED|nr:histone-like nucleoid-structuring protein, MvaT/MvaU family [Pseudomonas benzenivorans]WPC03483.1 histone-like nucleoid-structuring protein, MvaT/MvaU family [Pseudomonas benzenivorans]